MSATILRADALALPIADASVDLVVTSPPYFGLRSYQDGGEHYAGQLGSEPTPAEFVDALIAATREMVRVLKPSGSIWVNLGDKYAGSTRHMPTHRGSVSEHHSRGMAESQSATVGDIETPGIRPKSLIGIPWRYAIRCIDELGLILRAEVIWSKPNGLPESVTDRVRRSHEQWFHFTVQPRYFSAVDEIREAHSDNAHARRADGKPTPKQLAGLDGSVRRGYMAETYTNPLGKLPGSVWTVPTEPLRVPESLGVDHFAAFPTEWPRRIIAGWSPRGVCSACGEGRRPVAERKPMVWRPGPKSDCYAVDGTTRKVASGTMLAPAETRITGYACACPEPTAPATPGVVIDPFGGTGTVALVADTLGRHGISVDLSADYCRLAQWRTSDPKQRAKAARVDPAPEVPEPQDALDFGGAVG